MRNNRESKVPRVGIGTGTRNDISAAILVQNEAQWGAQRAETLADEVRRARHGEVPSFVARPVLSISRAGA